MRIIRQAVGQISESDVLLASASQAIIVGFHTRPDGRARELAEREKVEIRLYDIIYKAVEDVKQALEGLLKPELKEVVLGAAEIRQVFKLSKAGTVAGCMVMSGTIPRTSKVRLLREGATVWMGRIESLKRFKEDVKEVQSGFECGIALDGMNDVKVGDTIEALHHRRAGADALIVRPFGLAIAAFRGDAHRTFRPTPTSATRAPGSTPCSWASSASSSTFPPHPRSRRSARSCARLKERIRSRVHAAVAEVDHQDLWQRAALGVAVVSGERRQVDEMLQSGAQDRGLGVRGAGARLAGAAGMRIRPERVAQRMRREVADILATRMRDPRVGPGVSVTDVEVTQDLSFARVFVTVHAEGKEREQTLLALERAAGFVRRELAQRMELREVPEIRFALDTSIDTGARVDELLRKLEQGEPVEDDES